MIFTSGSWTVTPLQAKGERMAALVTSRLDLMGFLTFDIVHDVMPYCHVLLRKDLSDATLHRFGVSMTD